MLAAADQTSLRGCGSGTRGAWNGDMLLRVCDLEATGHSPPEHGVCEVGWADVTLADGDPTDWQVQHGFNSLLVNPGRPITPQTSAVHHIVDEDVADTLAWSEAVACLLDAPTEPISALVAHSAKFERQWITNALTGDLPFVCTYKSALCLWPDAPSHSNQVLRYWRRTAGLDRTLAHVAHRAGPDAYVTAFHLRDMLAMATLDQLLAWSAEPALQVRCRFGKHRGVPWREVDHGFLRWVAERDFDADVLFTVEHEVQRRREAMRDDEQAPEQSVPRAGGQDELELPF